LHGWHDSAGGCVAASGEVWLPAMFDGRGSARIVVFAYHSEQLDQHWSEYRKFRTTSTIVPVAAEAPDAAPATLSEPKNP